MLARARDVFGLILSGIGIFFIALLARRNWKLGRTDRKGALRIAIAQFGFALLGWIGSVHMVANWDMLGLFQASMANCVFSGVLIWVLYLALEPAADRR